MYQVQYLCRRCKSTFIYGEVRTFTELGVIFQGGHPAAPPVLMHPCKDQGFGIGEIVGLNPPEGDNKQDNIPNGEQNRTKERVLESPIEETGEHTHPIARGKGRKIPAPSTDNDLKANNPGTNVASFISNKNIDIPKPAKPKPNVPGEHGTNAEIDLNTLTEDIPTRPLPAIPEIT